MRRDPSTDHPDGRTAENGSIRTDGGERENSEKRRTEDALRREWRPQERESDSFIDDSDRSDQRDTPSRQAPPNDDERSETSEFGQHWLGENHPLGQRRRRDGLAGAVSTDATPSDSESVSDEPAGGEKSKIRPSAEPATPSDSRFNRRTFLLGGAGLAGMIAVAAGGWWLSENSETGAEALANAYMQAVAENDWESAEALYHEESQQLAAIADVGGYEAFLAAENRLESYEALEPVVESINVFRHVPNLTVDAREELFLPGEPDPEIIDEYKGIIVFVSIDTDILAELREADEQTAEYIGPESSFIFDISTVREGTDWYIWDTMFNI